MKTHHAGIRKNRLLKTFSLAICALALLFCFRPQKAEARTDVSFSFFYDSLEPYGDWVEVENIGTCWAPRPGYADWRPYSDGSWAYTEYGWTWVSDEPWGWATYHYGRWVLLEEGPGWVWVPGYEWGPAWVAWRSSDDYIGWAPLPPEPFFEPRSGLSIGVSFNFGPSWYNFCEVRHFGSRRLRYNVCRPEQNVTIINQTVNVTRVVSQNSTVFNGGPDLQVVNRRSERRIEQVKLARQEEAAVDRDTEAPRAFRSRNRNREQIVDIGAANQIQRVADVQAEKPRKRFSRNRTPEDRATKVKQFAPRQEPRVQEAPRPEKIRQSAPESRRIQKSDAPTSKPANSSLRRNKDGDDDEGKSKRRGQQ